MAKTFLEYEKQRKAGLIKPKTFDEYESERETSFEEYEQRTFSTPTAVADPNKPVSPTGGIPSVDIPEIADPQDVGLLPEQQIKQSRWNELRDAAATGLARVGSAGLQAVSDFWETHGTYLGLPLSEKSAQRKTEKQRAIKPREQAEFLWELSQNPALAAQNTDLASKGLRMVGETLPYITATTAAYIATGPVGGFAVGSLVEGNSAYRTALDNGVDPEKAKAIGVGVGIISGSIEAFGGKYAEELLSRASAKIRNKILRKGAQFGIGTVIEALEEGGQEVAQITGESTYKDIDWKEATNRTLGSMAGGVFLGGVMKGGGVSVRGAITADKQAKFKNSLIKNGVSEDAATTATQMLNQGRSIPEIDQMISQDKFGIPPIETAKPEAISDKEVEAPLTTPGAAPQPSTAPKTQIAHEGKIAAPAAKEAISGKAGEIVAQQGAETQKGRPTVVVPNKGLLVYEETDKGLKLQNIDVVEGERRQGIGKAMVEKAEELTGKKFTETSEVASSEGKAFVEGVIKPPEAPVTPKAPVEGKATKEAEISRPVGIQEIEQQSEAKGIQLDVFEDTKRKEISISKIVVPEGERGQGVGTSVIKQITDRADKQGYMVTVTPSTDFGGTSVKRLTEFYKGLGFVENKGKNKDLSISATMYRTPTPEAKKPAQKLEAPKKPKTTKMPEIASGGLPIEPPGLTKAEVEHLGKREQAALRAGQKRGLPVGYKKGYQEAALDGKRKLGKLRADQLINKASKEEVRGVINRFVPKDQQHRYLTRLARVKDAKGVEKITNQIERFVDDYEHRGAVREFKKFVSKTNKEYGRGEVKLGKLTQQTKAKIESVLKKYDTAKLSEEKAEELNKHKVHIQNVAGSVSRALREWESLDAQGNDVLGLPNRRIADLDRLEKIPLRDVTTEDIQYIQDELQSLITAENRKADVRKNIRSEFAHTYVTKAGNEIATRGLTARGEAKEHGIVRKVFGIGQANLRSLVKSATTKDAKASEEFLVDRIYDTKREAQKLHKEWYIAAQKAFKEAGASEDTINDLYSEITLKLGGKEVKVPKWTLLNLYLNTEADSNLKRLLRAREHQVRSIKGKTIYVKKITLRELQDAIKQMPPVYKDIADVMFSMNAKNNAPAINKTSMWERGYPIAIYEKYFPFPRKLRNIPQGHRTEIQQALENRGRYQKRTGGNLPHLIKDPMTEFLNGMQLDAQYSAMSLAIQDAKALLADNKWRTRMDKAGNKPIIDAVIKMYQRGEGMSTDRSVSDVLAGKFLSTMGKGTLSLRPSGGFIQTASLPAAYSVIPEKHFDSKYIPKPSDAKKLMEIDPTMWWRWENRQFDFVLGSQTAKDSLHKFVTGKDAKTDSLLKHYTWGDQWAVLKIWDASKKATENQESALKLFHRAMETQPQWDIWHRSLFTSEPRAFERSFAMFMSARNAQYNVLMQAKDDYAKGRISKQEYGKRVGDIVEASLRVSLYRKLFRRIVKYGALGLLFGVGKRDEEDIKAHIRKDLRMDARKIPQETIFNMVGLPVYGNIISNLADEAMKGFEGKWSKVKYGDVRTGSVIMDFLVDLGLATWGVGKFSRDLATQDVYDSGPKEGKMKWKYSGYDLMNNIGEIVSQLTGLPFSGVRSDVVWPVKEGTKKREKLNLVGMTAEELNAMKRDNRYKTPPKGKRGSQREDPKYKNPRLIKRIDKELESRNVESGTGSEQETKVMQQE